MKITLDMADQDEGDGPGELQWVECYDPIVEETYYYCHQNKETTYDPPDDYITAQEDPKMSAVIKIQCLGRKRMARHKVQRVRYHKYKDLAFDLDFCSGPAEILAGGMGVRKQDRASTNEEPLTAFVGTKAMSYGKHYFMFQISKLAHSEHGCELGLVPYVKPNHIRRTMGENAKSLRHLPGSWVVTSKGELYKSGSKVPAPWLESFEQGDSVGMVLDYDEHKISISRNAMLLGDTSITGSLRTDLVAGASLWSSGDEVAFQWCDRAPYEQFSMDVDSSSESIEALLSKYRGKKTAAGKAADQPPPPPGACRGIGEEGLDEARKLMDGLLQGQGKRAAAAAVVRAKAAVLKAKVEQEAKRKEADDKKAKLERKQALHRIPDSRERKESERRNRRKYLALQMERYRKARRKWLEVLEGRKKEQAAYVAQQIALRKEVLRLKREKEEERYAAAALGVSNVFEACRYGMPLWRLQDLVSAEALRWGRRGHDPVALFDQFCACVELGYVLESSHPYLSEAIDQCVEVCLEEGQGGVCVAFDPRCDTRGGHGGISFHYDVTDHDGATRSVGVSFCGLGLEVNMAQARRAGLSSRVVSTADSFGTNSGESTNGPSRQATADERALARVEEAAEGGTGGQAGTQGQTSEVGGTALLEVRDVGSPVQNNETEADAGTRPADEEGEKRPSTEQGGAEQEPRDTSTASTEGIKSELGRVDTAQTFTSGIGTSEGSSSVPATADSLPPPLPGVGDVAPIFIPATRFIIRFKALAHDATLGGSSWGWRLVAFAAESAEHGAALLERSVHGTHVARVVRDRRDERGDSLLHVAAWEGNVAAIGYLAGEGADVGAVDSVRTRVTPLHLAAQAGHLGAVKRLLELGADTLSRNSNGDTPLHCSCRNSHIRVARRLIKAERKDHSSVKAKNLRGHYAHEVVGPKGHSGPLLEMVKDVFDGRRRRLRRRNHHVIGA